MADVAIVVLNFNGRHLLPDCLASLERLTAPADVVVADNGSSDNSLAYLRAEHPHVQVLDLGRNLGFANGYNQALAAVDRPWLVLLNNDAALAADWLERLLAYAGAMPQAGILGGKLLFYRPGQPETRTHVLQSAGACFTDAGTAFEIGWGQPDHGQYDRPGEVGAIPGAAMLVRRSLFFELGGFEPDYHAYLEDVDLCWRAWLRGHEVHFVPGAVALHQYGASGGGRLSPFRIRWMQRNRLANMVKNLESGSLPGALAVSLTYDGYRVLEYLAKRRWLALRALLAGTRAFWRDLRPILARRRQIQKRRLLSDRALRSRGLLVPALEAFREYRRLGKTAARGVPD
ncbi:MAG: glycosyltransferase family 2 protein [Anaerolineales bacterium]|nr:glycosyltransferase family 2 protein [Anaerolineales bacterium]